MLDVRSKLEMAVGRRLVRMPQAWLDRLGTRLHVSIDGNSLDRRVKFALGVMHRASGGRALHDFGVEEGRVQMRRLPMLMDPEPPKVLRVDETEFDGPRGMVRLRIYVPPGVQGDAPVLVYFHGGGGVVGDLDTHDVPCRMLSREADCAVVSVDYGLAPETPFPGGLEDCIAAFRWVRDHPDAVGGDGRVAVGGDSMGGNLAASVSLATRKEDGPCFQLLIYPSTDPAGRTASRDAFGHGFLLEDESIEWFHRTYLRDADAADPRFSVLRAPAHEGVAPAYVATAGFDPLRDEGRAYAETLEAAGVRATYRCFGAQVHGFIHMTGAVPSAAAAMREVGAALRDGFARA
ncbi:MAG: alpha/beta hydrolase [Nannocystaceae bacterium]|nr:alpha/beta hydrolase [bacterium]